MYHVGLERRFRALHTLPRIPDPAEQERHEHPYRLQAEVRGPSLNDLGFLLDITVLEEELDRLLDTYAGAYLNDLDAFRGREPTLEVFADVLATSLSNVLEGQGLTGLRVTLWESDEAWAGVERELA
jgi:6-pyruvoyltetrahydropterin/6-carboxytetrahydropterin synthase